MKLKLSSIAFAGLISATAASAQTAPSSGSTAISGDIGTTGFGATLWITASPKFVVSFGYGTFDSEPNYSTDDVDFTSQLDLSNLSALVHWHPAGGPFHLSGGAVWADNSILVTGEPGPGNTYDFSGSTYTAAEVGTLTGAADYGDGVVPYLGLGWAKRPSGEGWGLSIDLGAILTGSANAALSATGPIAADPTFQQNLRDEENDLNDQLRRVSVFPVARLGVMYRF